MSASPALRQGGTAPLLLGLKVIQQGPNHGLPSLPAPSSPSIPPSPAPPAPGLKGPRPLCLGALRNRPRPTQEARCGGRRPDGGSGGPGLHVGGVGGAAAAQTLPSSLPSCRLRLQIAGGTDQKAKWTFGLGHRPASLSARPPPLPPHHQPSRPSKDERPAPPALSSS